MRKCITPDRSCYCLTKDKMYEIISEEPGIFANEPYVTLLDDNGIEVQCHASRFTEEVPKDDSE